MSFKHSLGQAKRWKKVPQKERSKIMSRLASIKQKKLGVQGRKKQALALLKARHKKYGTK